MSFERLKEALLAEAAQRATHVAATLTQAHEREKTRISQQARAIEEEIIAQAQQRADQEAKQLHQTQQLSTKAVVLRHKQHYLDQLQTEVTARILEWPEAATKELLDALLGMLPDTPGTVTPGERHATLVKKLVTSSKVRLSPDTIPADGGFIFKATSSEINLTIHSLVNLLFNRHKAELAQRLFN